MCYIDDFQGTAVILNEGKLGKTRGTVIGVRVRGSGGHTLARPSQPFLGYLRLNIGQWVRLGIKRKSTLKREL